MVADTLALPAPRSGTVRVMAVLVALAGIGDGKRMKIPPWALPAALAPARTTLEKYRVLLVPVTVTAKFVAAVAPEYVTSNPSTYVMRLDAAGRTAVIWPCEVALL